MVLRVRMPRAIRPFRTPFVWIVAPLGIGMCLFMMVFLPLDTWLRLAGWTVIGLAIYLAYGVRNARPTRFHIQEHPAE
jgi:APA family basic amino acid/polyamine antiporter